MTCVSRLDQVRRGGRNSDTMRNTFVCFIASPLHATAVIRYTHTHTHAHTYTLSHTYTHVHTLFDAALRPLWTALVQEVKGLNAILASLRRGIAATLAAVNAGSGTDADAAVVACLLNGTVPLAWQQLGVPADKPLMAWLNNLQRRTKYLGAWAGLTIVKPSAPPAMSFWLAGMLFPARFLLVLAQVGRLRVL